MFIGHYAPALAARALPNAPGLAAGFVAVQLIDVGFMTLTLFDIEKWALNLSLPGLNPLDFYFMPYTHSLLATAIWGLAFGLVYALFVPAGKRLAGGAIIFALVVSHWFVDLPVHRPDLGLIGDDAHKLGFSLWNWPLIAAPLELAVFGGAMAIYIGATRPKTWLGNVTPWIFVIVMVAAQIFNWLGAPPASKEEFAAMGLLAYGIVAVFGLMLDATREVIPREG
jgi:membrane-bound metal-dependent hydrolase YbcI (DUF457 family)